jgi:protein-tyrosine phosphatase
MVDIHCHILPGVDDGSDSWKTTLEMCRMAAADGVRHIVATPHANEEFRYDRQAHAGLLNELRHRCEGRLTFSLGCDLHLSYENFQAVLINPEGFCIEGTRYLLVEFSDFVVPPNTSQLLNELAQNGMTAIITHPERNPILQAQLERVMQWVESGAVVQITADTLTGRWGPRGKKAAKFLLDHAAVHVIASDAHGIRNRPPVLSEARRLLCKNYGEEVAHALAELNPMAIVAGEPLPYFPSPA